MCNILFYSKSCPPNSKSEDSIATLAQAKKQLTSKISTVIKQAGGNVSSLASGGVASLSTSSSSPSIAADDGGKTKSSTESQGEGYNGNGIHHEHQHDNVNGGSNSKYVKVPKEPELVLVIPLNEGGVANSQPPGFLTEEHVLERSRMKRVLLGSRNLNRPMGVQSGGGGAGRVVRMNLPGSECDVLNVDSSISNHDGPPNTQSSSIRINSVGVGDGTSNTVGEKRTRFSLSHDDGSIGNTSDNLEAISEAASNHSVIVNNHESLRGNFLS